MSTQPRTLLDKIWDAHVGQRRNRRHAGHAVRRSAPDPRSDLAAGLHRTAPARLAGASSGTRAGDLGSFHADHAGRCTWASTSTPRRKRPNRSSTLESNCAEFGIALAWLEQRAARHRARDRAGTGRHPARHDHRLRRQPHLDARRVRRAGLRHRHHRSRPRAGHAMPAAAQAEEFLDHGRWPPAAGRQRQGPGPAHHRQNRRQRRHRPCARISAAAPSRRWTWSSA